MKDIACNLPQLKPVCTLFPPTAVQFMGCETISHNSRRHSLLGLHWNQWESGGSQEQLD